MSDDHRLRPLDPPMTPVALAGLAGWAVAALLIVLLDGPREWLRICLAGGLLGLLGLVFMIVRDRRRATSRAPRADPRADQGESKG